MKENPYVITMLTANKPAVTSRVTGLFSGRGYNLESICGAPTHDPEVSRITIKTKATPDQYIEIQKQLERLIDIIKVRDMTQTDKAVQREMAIISIAVTDADKEDLIRITGSHNAKIISVTEGTYIFEYTGTEENVDLLITDLNPFGIKKVARSGILALGFF